MKPPYEITGKILHLISSISELIGEVKTARLTKPKAELRRRNRIKTIQSSLEIEGNSLTIEQITDLFDNKRIIAPKKDILEVQNAIKVYSSFEKFKVYNIDSLCYAHSVLMNALLDRPGQLRSTNVGIVRGSIISHLAPPGEMVYPLLKTLFEYLQYDEDILLIKSCVFHYEFEFIHPFPDGNGRMGRLWQTLILKEYSPVFEFLPIESLIKARQAEYYNVLAKSDQAGKSTLFIEFMLEIINISLEELLKTQQISHTDKERIELFGLNNNHSEFSRKDYLRHNKDISSATASRDLKNAVERGILKKIGDKRLTRYKFL
jgi:Fic family protein